MNWSKNIVLHQTIPGAPWDFKKTDHIPPEVRTDKKARFKWISNPETEHNVYSMVDGLNPNCRVHFSGEENSNPPRWCYGLVLDYDAAIRQETVDEAVRLKRLGELLPFKWSLSLSGHAQVIFKFEKPFPEPENQIMSRKWRQFLLDHFRFGDFLPGLEEGSFLDCARRFTNSGDWRDVSECVIEFNYLQGLFMQFVKKNEWIGTGAVTIPLEVAAEKFRERYPRFAEWPGEFEVGSQGPSFWVKGSESPMSAVVKETGILTLAAHAAKQFYHWSDPDLLGHEFVEKYHALDLARIVEKIYWNKNEGYWQLDGKGLFTPFAREDLVRHLTGRGVSPKRDPIKKLSPIDEATNYIQMHQRIDGAAPFIYRTETIIEHGGKTLLNTGQKVQALQPAPGEWRFCAEHLPFLFPLIDGLFTTRVQLERFLLWLARSYRNAYEHTPCPGQVVFIVGGVGVGKSFTSREVIGRLLGGFMDAAKYLSGESDFNSHMFHVGLWCADDNTTVTSQQKKIHYSEVLKSAVANREFQYHEKFRVAVMLPWIGRIIITLNSDEESLRYIPDLGISNSEKVMLFRAVDFPHVQFPSEAEMKKILELELPRLAAALLKMETPGNLRASRYGVAHYHEPSLLQVAKQSSNLASFEEILEDFLDEYFTTNKNVAEWCGTSLELCKQLNADRSTEMFLKDYTLPQIGRALTGLKHQGYPITFKMLHGRRIVCFSRETLNAKLNQVTDDTQS